MSVGGEVRKHLARQRRQVANGLAQLQKAPDAQEAFPGALHVRGAQPFQNEGGVQLQDRKRGDGRGKAAQNHPRVHRLPQKETPRHVREVRRQVLDGHQRPDEAGNYHRTQSPPTPRHPPDGL